MTIIINTIIITIIITTITIITIIVAYDIYIYTLVESFLQCFISREAVIVPEKLSSIRKPPAWGT